MHSICFVSFLQLYNLKICSCPLYVCQWSSFFDEIKRFLPFVSDVGIVKEMLALWPHLCKLCDSTNTSPLYSAAAKDRLDVVKAILDADLSSIRIVRKNGKTALHTVARYGNLPIVRVLIERDPGIVPIKDKKGQTALHMAVKGHNPAIVEEILEADHTILNERDKKGNTAVHIATRKCRAEVLLVVRSLRSNVIYLETP